MHPLETAETILQNSSSQQSTGDHSSSASRHARSSQAQKNLTKMIISINFIYIVTNASSFASIVTTLTFGRNSAVTMLSSTVSNTLLFITHSTTFFVYLAFDKLFNRIVKSTFHSFSLFERLMSSSNETPTSSRAGVHQ